MSPFDIPRWPKVTLFDDPDEERRVEAMREALRTGTFDEAEPYLGTKPGFATLLTDPPRIPQRFDSHGLESEDDGAGPFDGLKRYAQATRHEAPSLRDAPNFAPTEVRTDAPYLRYDHAFPRPDPKPVPPSQEMPTEGPLGPATVNLQLFPKRQQGPVSQGLNEAAGQAMGGVNDAVYNTLKTLDPIVEFLEEKVGHLPRYTHPGVKPAETQGGALVRDTARFLTGFVPFVKALRVTGAGELGAAVAAAGLSEGLTRSPAEENLVDLLNKQMELRKPVYGFLNEILGRDPNDFAAFKRAENAAIGAFFALGIEMSISRYLAKGVKLIGIARHAGITVEELLISAVEGATHTMLEKGVHAILPHGEPHMPGDAKP